MKACPKCNRQFYDDGQKFCTFDGGLLVAPQALLEEFKEIRKTKEDDGKKRWICPKCKREFAFPQKFCTVDGGLLHEVEPTLVGTNGEQQEVVLKPQPQDEVGHGGMLRISRLRRKQDEDLIDLKSEAKPDIENRTSVQSSQLKRQSRDPYHLVGSQVELQINSNPVSHEKLRLLRYAGGGGMGAVYYSRSPVRGEIAIKILKPDIVEKYPNLGHLFSREVKAASLLEHPNVVRFVGDGLTDEGFPFVAVEWLNGMTLDKYVEHSHPSIAQALAIFKQIGMGLAHAHERKIIHLDLKPENIFILANARQSEDNPIVKLIDFGLSRVMTTYSGTTATRFAGTPQYCSPEHLGYNGKLSTRSDIYSLGLILYYLIAGVLPIGGSAIMAKQFGHPVPVLPAFTGLDPLMADRLYKAVSKSIEFAPNDRFESVSQLLAALSI